MNNVILVGRVATDIDLSYTPQNNTAVAKFNLAVDRPRRDGQDQGADFIRITVWGRQAETTKQYLAKGRQCAVSGRIQTGSYKDRDGKTVYTTDVIAERVEFPGGNNGQNNNVQNSHVAQPVRDVVNEFAGYGQVQEPLPWEQ